MNNFSECSGVAAFFLKKFQLKKQASAYERTPQVADSSKRPFSASEIQTYEDPYADPYAGNISRASSRKSRNAFLLSEVL